MAWVHVRSFAWRDQATAEEYNQLYGHPYTLEPGVNLMDV